MKLIAHLQKPRSSLLDAVAVGPPTTASSMPSPLPDSPHLRAGSIEFNDAKTENTKIVTSTRIPLRVFMVKLQLLKSIL